MPIQNVQAKRGPVTKGRITQLLRGRSCGTIRTSRGENVFFHARDLEGVKYQDLEVGTSVSFELIDDQVSGARASFVKPANAKPAKKAG